MNKDKRSRPIYRNEFHNLTAQKIKDLLPITVLILATT